MFLYTRTNISSDLWQSPLDIRTCPSSSEICVTLLPCSNLCCSFAGHVVASLLCSFSLTIFSFVMTMSSGSWESSSYAISDLLISYVPKPDEGYHTPRRLDDGNGAVQVVSPYWYPTPGLACNFGVPIRTNHLVREIVIVNILINIIQHPDWLHLEL